MRRGPWQDSSCRSLSRRGCIFCLEPVCVVQTKPQLREYPSQSLRVPVITVISPKFGHADDPSHDKPVTRVI